MSASLPSSASSLPDVSALVGRDLAKTYGDRVVLDGVDLVASPAQPLGLVGENGVGKSTLLRLLAGLEPPDAGTVERPADLAHLGQDPEFPEGATIGDVLDDALAPLHAAVARLEALAADLDDPATAGLAADEYDRVLTWAGLHEAWEADRRADEAAARLGLGRLDRSRPAAALSGGQRSRLALAALVVRRPACVLLDEPTNHLDDQAVALLEEFVTSLPGVVVVASHDRAFLDAVCAVVVDLDPTADPGGSRYTGGYSDYLAAKRDARRRWQEAFEAQQDELDGLRRAATGTARNVAPHNRPPRDGDKFIHHFKGQNVARTISRRVRDTERRIEVLERDRIPKPPAPFSFRGVLAPVSGTTSRAVVGRDLRVDGRLHVERVDVPTGGRLLVTGANGSGKSTLLKVVAGELTLTSGHLDVSARRVGHLPQDVVFADPARTAAEVFDRATGSPVPLAELGLLHPREQNRPVGVLSTGQQRRLGLAVLVARRPDLLLLDEPTNHVSLALAEELEESFGRSPGTVVVASHDRWLRRRWDGDVLAL